MPRLGRVRQPAPRPGRGQRLLGDRLRHLRVERPADPGPLPRGRPGAPARDAGRGPRPQPVHRPAADGPAASRSSASLALPWQGRDRALRPVLLAERHHVPGHEPGLPGRDDLGHVPPRGRARPRAAGRLGAARPRRRDRPARGSARLDPAGRLARPGPRHLRVAPVLGRAAAVVRVGLARDRRTCTPSSARRMAAAGRAARRDRGPGHHQLPDLAREATGVDALALPDEPAADVLDLAASVPRAPASHRAGANTGAGRPSLDGRRSRQPRASAELDLGAGESGPATADPLADTRAFEVVCP